MKLRTIVMIALLAGSGCSMLRRDKPRLNFTPITGAAEDYQPIVQASSAARFLLLGEATHGTREFVDERWRITEAMAAEGRLLALVIEADAGETDDASSKLMESGADDARRAFAGYPSWPWSSESFRNALDGLNRLNGDRSPSEQILLVGLDFHGFDHVVERLRSISGATPLSPEVEKTADCLGRYKSAYDYGRISRGSSGPCSAFTASLQHAAQSEKDPTLRFRLTHLARTLEAAELYHVAIANGTDAWSFRENHMYQTLLVLDELFQARSGTIVVWAHNTHTGDARVTSFRPRPSLGQFFRESRPGQAYLVGFMTGGGTLRAARAMGLPPVEMKLNPPLRDSVEHVLGRACKGSCLAARRLLASDLNIDRPERAIGLVYRRDDELRSHYIRSVAARQFDAIVYIESTTAVGGSPEESAPLP